MEVFSKFNICWGYNHIQIRESDQWKEAFKMRRGLFKPKVMFFRMCNSPAAFQQFMNAILEPWYKKHGRKKGKNYMNDIAIGTLLKELDLHIEMIIVLCILYCFIVQRRRLSTNVCGSTTRHLASFPI